MKLFTRALLAAAAAATLIAPAQASLVTWDFAGTWASTDYGPHGTNMAGSVTFNTLTYQATAFSFTVSGYTEGAVTYTMTAPTGVGVSNDVGYDLFDFRGTMAMSGPNVLTGSLPWQTASFTLFDVSQAMLSSTAIPNTPPSLSGLTAKNVTLIYGQGTFNDVYTLTSLSEQAPPPPPPTPEPVPEPATMGLLGAGLAGVAFFRRRK